MKRFGYHCEQGNCNLYSTNNIAFYTGSESSSDLADSSLDIIAVSVVDCRESPLQVFWDDRANIGGRWKLNRTGSGNSLYASSYSTPSPWCRCSKPFPNTNTKTWELLRGQSHHLPTQSPTVSPTPTDFVSCNFPNRSDVVDAITASHPKALQDSDCANGFQNSNWEFVDRVVKTLHDENPKWGYNCVRGNCSDLSEDALAYYCGDGQPNSNSINVAIIGYHHRG